MRVEILTPPDDGFVIGRDLIGYANIGGGPDTWTDVLPAAGSVTATRGGTTSRVNTLDVGTLTIPIRDANPVTDLRLRVGRHIRLRDDTTNEVHWYGRITDIPATDEGDYTVTTLVATDAVDSLANSTRYGAGDYGTPETLRSRVTRLGTTATVPLIYRREAVALEVDLISTALETPPTASAAFDAVPGHRYRVTATITSEGSRPVPGPVQLGYIGIDGAADAAVGAMGATADEPIAFEFVATAAVHEVVVGRYSAHPLIGIYIRTDDLVVTRLHGPEVLQAVAYEGPVAEHLNMACDSVGAVWRPTLDGGVEILEGHRDTTPVASFTDNHAASPADTSYTRLSFGYATGDDLVNDLTVTNHGRTSGGDADDTTHVATNATSIANHGRRAGTLDTCLIAAVATRAGQVLADLATPEWGPRSLTYVYDTVGRVPDLYDIVTVWRRGVAYNVPTLGIEHQITPDPDRPHQPIKYLVTLTLGKATP